MSFLVLTFGSRVRDSATLMNRCRYNYGVSVREGLTVVNDSVKCVKISYLPP